MAAGGLVAIVTGAAQGLGLAITERLLQEGYKVCLADLNEEKGSKSLAELQEKYSANKVIFVKCDVTSESNFEAVFSKTQKVFGRIDLLVNNAGTVNEYEHSRVVQINLMGTINGCQLALKFMGTSNSGKGGVVINVASVQGLIKAPFSPVYCSTKHAVIGLTKSYGDQYHLESNGVLFMAICPHAIRTELFLKTAKFLKPISETVSVEAMEPEYVAQGVIKLLNDKCNGSSLLITLEKMEYIAIPDQLKDITL